MFFSVSPKSLGLFVGDSADLIFTIDVNDWMGRRSVQLIVKDIRASEKQTVKNDGERARFARIWAGDTFGAEEDILPDRNDFAAVYRLILASSRMGVDTLSHREICAKSAVGSDGRRIGYIKLKIIIKVLTELNVVGIEEHKDEVYTFRLHYSSGKADLEKSSLLRRLRAQQRSEASDRQ
jgi:single-stranded-DNA-specific exonuclease